MSASSLTMAIEAWHACAVSGRLRADQLAQLKAMLLAAAQDHDQTLAILKAQTQALAEADQTIAALTARLKVLDARVAQLEGGGPQVVH